MKKIIALNKILSGFFSKDRVVKFFRKTSHKQSPSTPANMRKSIPLLMPKKSFNKQLQTIILLLLISLSSCKKDKPDPTVPSKIRQELRVIEANSNIPIKGATVIGSFCSGWGLCGYPDSAITNDSGKVVFLSKDVGMNTFEIHANKYWPAFYIPFNTDDSNNLVLTPIAILKVRITKVDQSQYPSGSVFKLGNAMNSCNGCVIDLPQLTLTLPQDRIVYMKGAGGGTSNYLEWYVDSGQQIVPNTWNITPSVVINRSDTAEFLIEY